MHYRHGEYGFPVLLEAENFTALWPESALHKAAGRELEIREETAGVQLLRF
jgi:hypothetical protein